MHKIGLLGTCLFVLCLAAPARADHGDLGLAYLYGYGAGTTIRPQSFVPAPPYFALHPPVYYGARYSRPYGVSPFASWPQLQASATYAPRPTAPRVAPLCIECDSSGAEPVQALGVVQVAPAQPLEIENPHFRPEVQYTSAE